MLLLGIFVQENPFIPRRPLKGLRTMSVPQLCMSACEAIAGFALDCVFLQETKPFSCNRGSISTASKEPQTPTFTQCQPCKTQSRASGCPKGARLLQKLQMGLSSPPPTPPLSQCFRSRGPSSPVTELGMGLAAAQGAQPVKTCPKCFWSGASALAGPAPRAL